MCRPTPSRNHCAPNATVSTVRSDHLQGWLSAIRLRPSPGWQDGRRIDLPRRSQCDVLVPALRVPRELDPDGGRQTLLPPAAKLAARSAYPAAEILAVAPGCERETDACAWWE